MTKFMFLLTSFLRDSSSSSCAFFAVHIIIIASSIVSNYDHALIFQVIIYTHLLLGRHSLMNVLSLSPAIIVKCSNLWYLLDKL